MFSLTRPVLDLLLSKSHRVATLMKVTREDGTVLRLTDHSNKISFEGAEYTPTGGFSASARQQQGQLKKNNAEIVGIIDADAITDEDLISGRYNNAKIEEILVDWRFPFSGAMFRATYTVLEVEYDGRTWIAQIAGLTHRLSIRKGRTYSRTCSHDLGDVGCKVNLAPLTESTEVDVVVESKTQFQTPLTDADGYFDGGLIVWTSGNNSGFESEVKSYLMADGEITLFLETPFPIEVGDEFDIYPGCDKTVQTCKDKFSNVVNFGGFSFIPGDDRLILTPDAKQ